MRCDEFTARLPDELAGRLDDTERAALREHVSACPACLQELESLGDVWGLLAEARVDIDFEVATRFIEPVNWKSPVALLLFA